MGFLHFALSLVAFPLVFSPLGRLGQLQPVVVMEPSPALLAQLLTALAVGLLTAFGLQLLLANLGVAVGISAVAIPAFAEDPEENQDKPSPSLAGWVGPGILASVNLVLFVACFLAARFSQVGEPWGGAIAGLAIWSAYLLILIWLSTKTLNSVAGFIFDWTTGGLRRLVSLIAAALEPSAPEPLSEAQMLETIRQEVRSSLDSAELRRLIALQLQTLTQQAAAQSQAAPPLALSASVDPNFWQPIETYLAETSAKSLTPKRVNRRLQKLLQSAYDELPPGSAMPPLPMALLAEQIQGREDLSDKKKQRVLTQLEATWAEFEENLEPPQTAASSPTEDSAGFDPAAVSQDLLQSAAKTALQQVLSNLPDLLQKVKPDLPYGLGIASVMLSEVLPELKPEALSDSLLESLPLEPTEVRQYVEHLLDETQDQIALLGKASLHQADQLRELALKPVEQVQQGVQTRIATLKQQAHEQAEATRRAAAAAAWWLFATASTGAVSAAAAGALATGALPLEVAWPWG
jgi:hypothetical protein